MKLTKQKTELDTLRSQTQATINDLHTQLEQATADYKALEESKDAIISENNSSINIFDKFYF